MRKLVKMNELDALAVEYFYLPAGVSYCDFIFVLVEAKTGKSAVVSRLQLPRDRNILEV